MRTDGYHYINNIFLPYCSNEVQLKQYSYKLVSYSYSQTIKVNIQEFFKNYEFKKGSRDQSLLRKQCEKDGFTSIAIKSKETKRKIHPLGSIDQPI